MPRLFVAVDLEPAVVKGAARLISELRARSAAARGLRVAWTEEGNLHVTLRFLGSTPAERIEAVCAALDESARGHAPFELEAAGLGAFPSPSRARVLWVGVSETGGGSRLAALAADLEARMRALGFPPEEREFSPHLTIGRVKEGAAPGRLLEAAQPALGRSRIQEIVLYESRTLPSGAVYTPLQRFSLLGAVG